MREADNFFLNPLIIINTKHATANFLFKQKKNVIGIYLLRKRSSIYKFESESFVCADVL